MLTNSTLDGKKLFIGVAVPMLGRGPSGESVFLTLDANGRLEAVLSAADVVTIAPAAGALTDRSGTITAGGTAQQAAAAMAARKYLLFQNHSDTDMWINFGTVAVATQPSIKIVAGAEYENPSHFCPNGLVSVICATTGKAFTCKEA